MKLFYATSLVYPSGLANRLQIFAMCQEFVKRLGKNFWLGARSVEFPEAAFSIINFYARTSYVLAWRMLWFIREHSMTTVYGRERALLFFIWFYNKIFFRCDLRFFYEVHELPKGRRLAMTLEWMLTRVVDGYIFVTYALEGIYKKRYQNLARSIVAPDGVDLAIFDIQISRDDARRQLNLPLDKFIIGYCGRFRTMGMEKGLLDVLHALPLLPPNVIFVAMGGKQNDLLYYRAHAVALGVTDRALFVENFNQHIVALYQKAADALVMPFPFTEHYAYYMSPMKMFEYMASGRPIITTDLPSVREVLNENNALFVPPGDPRRLAEAIQHLFDDRCLSDRLAVQACKDVRRYTWENRCRFLFDFLGDV